MKVVMKRHIRLALTSLVISFLPVLSVPVFALDKGDELKLKELEQAIKGQIEVAPAEMAPPKKRTRAIVFDNDAGQESAPAAAAQTRTKSVDCASLPPDVRAVQVDFAIQFKVGSADVAPSSEDTLRQIAKILSLAPDRCVLVEGHSDSTGNFDMNMSLSKERAGSVVRYIVDRAGIDRSRLVSSGKGSTEPLKTLDPRDARNRRVVFKVVG